MVHLELLAVVGTDDRIIFKLKRGIFEIIYIKLKKITKEELTQTFLVALYFVGKGTCLVLFCE
jgi:hypothetical protein